MTWWHKLRKPEDFENWFEDDYDKDELGFYIHSYDDTYHCGFFDDLIDYSRVLPVESVMMYAHLYRELVEDIPPELIKAHVRGRPCAVFSYGGRFYFKPQISSGLRFVSLLLDEEIMVVLLKVEGTYLFCTQEGVLEMENLNNLSAELRRVFP
jgi:hypothetical protein